MQGAPQPGMARETSVRGNSTRKPIRGPRSHQAPGHLAIPIQKPIAERARNQAQIAVLPSMKRTSNFCGIGPCRSRGTQPREAPRTAQTAG